MSESEYEIEQESVEEDYDNYSESNSRHHRPKHPSYQF